jgi:peptidoglycan/LPS O-acetylase OafA/YrhL
VKLQALLNAVRRETTSGRFVGEIDGLRFYAILAVLLFHVDGSLMAYRPWLRAADGTEDWIYAITSAGHYGVQLFFVLSGFVLGLPFAEAALGGGKQVTLGAYLRRRVTRLEPPYAINLTVMAVLLVLVNGASPASIVPRYLAALCYVDSWLYGYPILVNFVAWSLEIEVQFYLLAPVLAGVFLIRNVRARRSLLLAGVAGVPFVVALAGLQNWHEGQTLLHNISFFLAGFLIVDLWLNEWQRCPSRTLLWDAVGVGCVAGIVVIANNETGLPVVVIQVVMAVLCAGIVSSGFRGAFQHHFLRSGMMPAFGGMCYTIYLWHPAIKSALCKAASALPPTPSATAERIALLCGIVVLILISAVPFFLLFEKPFMKRDWPSTFRASLRKVIA